MDALLCSSGSAWLALEEIRQSCKEEVDEVITVLKPGGRIIYISFGQPHLERSERCDGSRGRWHSSIFSL
jgi:EEF1A lysine methyltransferase 4